MDMPIRGLVTEKGERLAVGGQGSVWRFQDRLWIFWMRGLEVQLAALPPGHENDSVGDLLRLILQWTGDDLKAHPQPVIRYEPPPAKPEPPPRPERPPGPRHTPLFSEDEIPRRDLRPGWRGRPRRGR